MFLESCNNILYNSELCFFKNHKNVYVIIYFHFLVNCQLQEPTKNHGILFLENRSAQLKLNVNNKNDVLKLIEALTQSLFLMKIVGFISKEF